MNLEATELSITADISTEKRNQSYQFLEEYISLIGSKFSFFKALTEACTSSRVLELISAILVLPLPQRGQLLHKLPNAAKRWLKRVPERRKKQQYNFNFSQMSLLGSDAHWQEFFWPNEKNGRVRNCLGIEANYPKRSDTFWSMPTQMAWSPGALTQSKLWKSKKLPRHQTNLPKLTSDPALPLTLIMSRRTRSGHIMFSLGWYWFYLLIFHSF